MLFVDDNPVNGALVHDQFDVLGYRADVAANVADASNWSLATTTRWL
ncbi:hypothetical protein [Burkholderia sp. JP2-270]|nr:hypothetical protein [Burkholderia sp. JP2-270]